MPANQPQPRKLHPTVLDTSAVQIGRVYAQALYGAAAAANQAAAVLGEYEALVTEVLDPNPGLERVLASVVVSRHDKEATLRRLFEERLSPVLLRYLLVLNHHGRLGLIRAVLHELRVIHNERTGRVPVEVRLATEPDGTLRQALVDRLAAVAGGQPVVHTRVDPALLGGLVVRVADTVYDASLRTRLRRVRDQLRQRTIHEIQSRRDQFRIAT